MSTIEMIMIVIGIVSILVGIIHSMTKEPFFLFGTKVKIKDGFYKGQVGHIVGRVSVYNWNVRFNSILTDQIVEVSAFNLEVVK